MNKTTGLSPTWQIIIGLVIAMATTGLTHLYILNRDRKKHVLEASARAVSSGQLIRANYLAFLEFDFDFSRLQEQIETTIKTGDEKRYEILKEAGFVSQRTAMSYRDQLGIAQKDFVESTFLLTALENRTLGSNDEFMDAIQAVMLLNEKPKDYEAAKKIVENYLTPNLEIITAEIHRIVNSNYKWTVTSLFKVNRS